MKSTLLISILLFSISNVSKSQSTSFQIAIEPISIKGLGGVQAFAYGRHDGKWLVIGGRLDGLHRRQPFASFAARGNNIELIVIDPVSLQKWNAPLTSLSIDLQEQLGSTNMQFHQDGKYLYLIGGYGYSSTLQDHTTYGKLAVVDVPNTIDAIITGSPFASYFRQIADTGFAVTGGHLKKINDTYYLVGGQKFIGRYNPMGPDHGPGFFQQYTDQVRKFKITEDGTKISITNYQTMTDGAAFHRRDYNVVAQILPNGSEGLTLFSGVFQPIADIPYLNSVTIDTGKYLTDHSFAQYYNHYHCAVLPMYSQRDNEMHNVFFGGIAQYFDSAGVLVQNSDVPFVNTIACVTRNKAGDLSEYKLPVEMPSLLGAGAEFIMFPKIPQYPNEVIKLDSITADTTLVGHIFGGIASTAPNIFWVNTGEESSASSELFKVYLIRNTATGIGQLNKQSNNGLQMQVYPDTFEGVLSVKFFLTQNSAAELEIADENGKLIKKEIRNELTAGENVIHAKSKSIKAGKTYKVTLKASDVRATQSIIIEPE